jgi:hypothetical protein
LSRSRRKTPFVIIAGCRGPSASSWWKRRANKRMRARVRHLSHGALYDRYPRKLTEVSQLWDFRDWVAKFDWAAENYPKAVRK